MAEGTARSREASETSRRRSGRAKLPLIGAQISTAGGFGPVPERAVAIGAEIVQIFSSNPRTWRIRWAGPEEMELLKAGLRLHALPLYLHTIYLINLASPDPRLREHSAKALAHALATGALTGAAGVVTHIGSHKGEGFESSADRVTRAIHSAVIEAEDRLAALGREESLPELLLENTAGSGSTIGSDLEELACLLAALADQTSPVSRVQARLCLDTAHLFAAGYAVHKAAGLQDIVGELRRLGLLRSVGLIHLNDSATPFGSKRDRHENPGEGQIGHKGLERLVRHPAFSRIPFVLEVPGEDGRGPDAANVALVKSMRAGARALPSRPARGA